MRPVLIAVIVIAAAAQAAAATLDANLSFSQSPRVALVWFADDAGATPADITVDQIDKIFTKPLVVGAPGSTVIFTNSDRLQHNVYADEPTMATSFDAGLADPGTSTKQAITWKDGEVVRCGCKIHPRMQVYVASLASRFYQAVVFPEKVGEGKPAIATASIGEVPAGLRRVRIWVPKLGMQEVDVVPGQPAQAVFRRNDLVLGTVSLRLD